MGNIRAYSLGIVTENQNNAKKAEALAALLVDYLPNIYHFHLKKYDKFPNSYRIELEGKFINGNIISMKLYKFQILFVQVG